MKTLKVDRSLNLLLSVLISTLNYAPLFSQGWVIGHDQAHLEDLKSIPKEWIDSAKAHLRIVYWHTSHGGHITTGMSRLDAFMGGNGLYSRSQEIQPGVLYLVDYFGDLSAGEETWPQTTRDYLDDPANQDINVVMWSWCQILGHDGDENPGYVSKMDSLITDYGPGGTKVASGERTVPVRFVFMTGHVNGQGEEGRTNQINTYIRNHCLANNRILYDFADIESWDPDDQYFLDDSVRDDCSYMVNGERTGNWAEEWIIGKVRMDGEDDTVHNEPHGGDWYECTAEHSHPVNANMKAYAAWYLFSRLAGWKILLDSLHIGFEGDSAVITSNRGTLQMTARIFPLEADDTSLIWSVLNGTGEADISETGLLQAVSNGMVTVVATANDGSGTADSLVITISNQFVPVSSISLSGKNDSTAIEVDDGSLQIYASIIPADATDTTLTWTISHGTGIATVSETGLLQALNNGTVTVVAAANDGSGVRDSLQVTISNQIIQVSSISLSGEGGITYIDKDNGTLQIMARVLPPDASDTTLTWNVKNLTGEASISEDGLCKAFSDGIVMVMATACDGSGIQDSLEITISHQVVVLVSSISISGEGGSTTIGQDQGSMQFSAIVLPENADDTSITWSVINGSGTASISPGGLLQAGSAGSVVVVASARDGSGVSDSLRVDIWGQTTGMGDLASEDFTIASDGSSRQLHIRWKEPPAGRYTVRIYNILGQMAYYGEGVAGDHGIDLSGYEPGYYILIIHKTKRVFAPYKFLVK